MKKTLNPFENAKRIANGAGGASPAIIEEMQEEISILGSQNSQQAQDITDIKAQLLIIGSQNSAQVQDITDIKAQLTNLVAPYSTTKHKTGRKWSDGKDIFEIIYHYENGISLTNAGADSGIPYTNFDKIINCYAIGNNCQFLSCNTFCSSGNIRVSVHEPLTVYDIVFEYTEPTS